MSQENLDVVRAAIVAYNRGDLDALADYWTDDIDYRAVEGRSMTAARCAARTPCWPTCRTGSTHSTASTSTRWRSSTREGIRSWRFCGSAGEPSKAASRPI